jgi:hypothetical protein
MSEGVDHCFSANEIDLVPNSGHKLTWLALNMNPVFGRLLDADLLRQMRERRLNTYSAIEGAKTPQGCASLLGNLPHELQNTAKHWPCRRIVGQMVLGDVQLQGSTEDPLQEGVVKVLRYTGAFRQAVLKTTVHALTVMQHPDAVERNDSYRKSYDA